MPEGLSQENEHAVTRIKGCATMWHESPQEMAQMLKSIFRMDEDVFARYVLIIAIFCRLFNVLALIMKALCTQNIEGQ